MYILKNDKKFHVFACFSNTDELDINEVKDAGGRKYTKDELVFLKSSIDKLCSLKEFRKAYKEFKSQHANIKNIGEVNKEFRKEFGIPDRIAIPSDLYNLIY
jgi:DNA topoisomerase IB